MFVYKIVALLVGLTAIVLGYLLFVQGVFGPVGDLQAARDGVSMSLKNAAPGIFFALFGACVIGVTVYKGLTFEASRGTARRSEMGGKVDEANLEWQNVLNSIRSLRDQGKLNEEDLALFHLNMGALASALASLDRYGPQEADEQTAFRGFAAAPPP